MMPYLHFFNIELPTYALLSLIGLLLAGFLCCVKCKKYNIDDNDMIVLLLISSIGIVIGGHILFGITNMEKIINFFHNLEKLDSFKLFIDCMLTIFGGQVFYGGLIGGLVTGYLFAKKKKWDTQKLSYIVTPFIPLFHFFGRIGCFLGGCCYGIESKIGFSYHKAIIEAANNVSRFPIQLVEAGCNLILFIVLYILQKKDKCKETLLFIYLNAYSVIRFFIEFFRGDEYRGFIGGLSTSQIISIGLFTFSLCMLLKAKKKNNKKEIS